MDGVWTSWTNWTECNMTCGGGHQERNRTCDGAAHGGAACVGDDGEIQLCNPEPCPGTSSLKHIYGSLVVYIWSTGRFRGTTVHFLLLCSLEVSHATHLVGIS